MSSYQIDRVRPEELPFVYSATKKSLRHSPEYAEKSNFEAYSELNPLVNRVIPSCDVVVARRGAEILGFIAFAVTAEAITVAFVYVKYEDHAKNRLRRRGIARELLVSALDEAPATAELRYLFPTSRFAALAERYGFVEEAK